MATTFPWGESVTVLMELGFPTNPFTLDSASLGVLDSNALDGSLLGDDVSSYCREISVSRGRTDQLANFSAGTAQFRLLNNDRRFDPINEDSPYWDITTGRSGVTPRRKVTVLLDNEAVYVGRITDIDVLYDFNLSEVAITTSDDFVLLANVTTGTAFTPPEEVWLIECQRCFVQRIIYPADRIASKEDDIIRCEQCGGWKMKSGKCRVCRLAAGFEKLSEKYWTGNSTMERPYNANL